MSSGSSVLNFVHETSHKTPRPFKLNAIVDGVSVEPSQGVAKRPNKRRTVFAFDDRTGNVLTTVALFAIAAAVLYLAPGVFFILLLSLMQMNG